MNKKILLIFLLVILFCLIYSLQYKKTKKPNKVLARNEYFSINQKIPKIIHMCFKTKKAVPKRVFKLWKKLNPEYKLNFSDDKQCYNFLKNNFSIEYAKYFNEIPWGPIKADFWRLCVLYINGGVYADIDLKPLKPLRYIVNNNTTFSSCLNIRGNHIFQAFIASTPKNPILKKCIKMMYEKRRRIINLIKYGNPGKSSGPTYWKFSGTTDMYIILKYMLKRKPRGNKTYILKDQVIKLLQEYGSHSDLWNCVVRYRNKTLFRSRYDDYITGEGFIRKPKKKYLIYKKL